MNNYIYFTPFSSVFVVNFKQANVNWVWRWNCSSLKFTIFSKFLLFFPHLFTLLCTIQKKKTLGCIKDIQLLLAMYELNPTRAGLLDDESVEGQGYVKVSLQFWLRPTPETNSWKNIFLIKSLQNIIQHISCGQQILFWHCYISYGPQILF